MTNEYYSLKRIDAYDTKYKVIVGERSNGKTYSVKKRVIENWENDKVQFMYIRRTHAEITRNLMRDLFNDINEEWYEKEYGKHIEYIQSTGFVVINDEGEIEGTIGYCTSLEDGLKIKGISYPQITTIWFDEFLSIEYDLQNEESRFLNIISTIRRKRDNVTIYMLGNTVTRYSKYFKMLGIDITKVRKGHIYYLQHKMGASIAFEYCSSMNIIDGNKKTDKYLGFDNTPASSMILYGEWEYQVVNDKSIDGIGWSSDRMFIPIYITAIGEVYELSLYISNNPIAFVRRVNTQNGMVGTKVLYNLSYDNSVTLINKNGIVPTYGKMNKLIDERILNMFNTFMMCIEAKRVVYESMPVGSDFNQIIKYL